MNRPKSTALFGRIRAAILRWHEDSSGIVSARIWPCDSVQAFIEDRLAIDKASRPAPRMERGELYKKYETYCEDEGRTAKTRNGFYGSLRDKGFREVRLAEGRYFEGLAEAFLPDLDGRGQKLFGDLEPTQ